MVSLGVRQQSLCCPLRKCRRKFVVWERKWEMPLERPLRASQSYRLQSCHQNTPLHCWDSDTILRRKSIRQQGSHCLQGLNFSKSAFRQRKLFFSFSFSFQPSPFSPETMFRNVQKFNCFYKHLLHKSNYMSYGEKKTKHENATTNAQNRFKIIKRFTPWLGQRTVFSLLHLNSSTPKRFSKE